MDVIELASLVAYDPLTGQLTYLERPRGYFKSDKSWKTWNTRFSGRPAMNVKNSRGYLVGRVNNTSMKAHRAAWALHYGRWPTYEIDHVNGNKMDNRIENLRDVRTSENGKNRPKQRNNTSGVTGVGYTQTTGKWFARIKVSQKLIHLGYFNTKEGAVRSRLLAENRYGFTDRHGK
jgi:hypothetical protein